MKALIAIVGLGVTFLVTGKKLLKKHKEVIRNKWWFFQVQNVSALHNIPIDILVSQIWQESAGNENAVSSANAKGLLQIKDIVLEDYRKITGNKTDIDLFNPLQNLSIGAWYLSHLRDRFGLSLFDALQAYANGIGNVQKGRLPHPNYATEIFARARFS